MDDMYDHSRSWTDMYVGVKSVGLPPVVCCGEHSVDYGKSIDGIQCPAPVVQGPTSPSFLRPWTG